MAAQIIAAIESGFTLLSSLATNFLTAFSTLVWDSTLNSGAGGLTPVSEFAMIILSISIVMSVLGLAFAFLRGNTGA